MRKNYQWFTSVKNDKYSGCCKLCLKTFGIDGSGIPQVKSHENCKSHKSNGWSNSQTRFTFSNGIATLDRGLHSLALEDKIVKAEIL